MTRHSVTALVVFTLATVTRADTIHVYTGESIQAAIGGASTGDEIVVHPGTYVGLINLLGKVITLRSTDGPDVTIVDGDAGDSVITCTGGEGPDTVIEGFTITNGLAERGGGMRNDNQSNPTVINCRFCGNSATLYGGGMYNDNSSPTLTHCTFSGNDSAAGGGGMTNYNQSRPKLVNCTFAGNTASYWGGGIYVNDSGPTLVNCILWGDYGAEIYVAYDAGTVVCYCCVQGGFVGTGNISGVPLFVDADGADDVIGTPDDNLRLQSGSDCIDAGISLATLSRDLDGNQRIVDDPATPDTGLGLTDVIDMGPYEYGSIPPIPKSADLDGDGDVDMGDFTLFQQQFNGPQ